MQWAGRRIAAGGPIFVFRPRIGLILCLATAVALLAWAVIEIRENGGAAWERLPAMVLIGLSVFAWFGRPCVRVDRSGVRLANVLTDIDVPYGELAEVDTRYALTLLDRSGRRHRAWAAPASRAGVGPPADETWWDPDRLALPTLRNDAGTVAAVVRAGRQRHRLTVGVGPGADPVTRRPVRWLVVAWPAAALVTVAVAVLA